MKLFILQQRDIWLSTASAVCFGVFSSKEKAIAAIKKNAPDFIKDVEKNYPKFDETLNQWTSDRLEMGFIIIEAQLDTFEEI
jgi:hypothetical protein